jgi:hypothetical protein
MRHSCVNQPLHSLTSLSVHMPDLLMFYINVTSTTDGIISSANQPYFFNSEPSVNCPNCISVQEQIHYALLQLESVRTIISLLCEGFNKAITSEATNIPMQSVPCERSGYERVSAQWIAVVHCSNTEKKMPTVTS